MFVYKKHIVNILHNTGILFQVDRILSTKQYYSMNWLMLDDKMNTFFQNLVQCGRYPHPCQCLHCCFPHSVHYLYKEGQRRWLGETLPSRHPHSNRLIYHGICVVRHKGVTEFSFVEFNELDCFDNLITEGKKLVNRNICCIWSVTFCYNY